MAKISCFGRWCLHSPYVQASATGGQTMIRNNITKFLFNYNFILTLLKQKIELLMFEFYTLF